MSNQITDTQLGQAFDRFLAIEVARVPLDGAELNEYVASLRSAFEHYRSTDKGTLTATPYFLLLESRCSYISYGGEGALRTELPPDSDEETLGCTAIQTFNASRRTMFDYLEGRAPDLDREAGQEFYRRFMEQLCSRHGIKGKSALQKVTKTVMMERNWQTGQITYSPMRRVKADYFEGLGPDFDVSVAQASEPAEIGRAARAALDRCI